mmetsp:Transcript_13084/g.31976  ORF Transcript_13084/g.31976 Transcript_13084/m.31976 type:complete len:240 (-) Transcript_13084:2524-3243(-)
MPLEDENAFVLIQHVFGGASCPRIELNAAGDQVQQSHLFQPVQSPPLREPEGAPPLHQQLGYYLLQVRALLVRQLPQKQFREQAPRRPDVHLLGDLETRPTASIRDEIGAASWSRAETGRERPPALEELGRHVARGAALLLLPRDMGLLHGLRQPKVAQLCVPPAVQHHVHGLQVPVHHGLFRRLQVRQHVEEVQPFEYVQTDLDGGGGTGVWIGSCCRVGLEVVETRVIIRAIAAAVE